MAQRLLARRLSSGSFNLARVFTSDSSGNCHFKLHAPLNNVKESEDKLNEDGHDLYDIAIVGGGMVGMALACALSRNPLTKNLSVAIIDSNPALISGCDLKRDGIPEPRVSTVTPATISFFKDVGAWKYVQQQRHAYFDKMQVWDYYGFGYTRYNARDVDKEILGCVVENKVLQNSLISSLLNSDFQVTIHSSRLASMSFNLHYPSACRDNTAQQSKIDNEASCWTSCDNLPQKYLNSLVKLDLINGTSLHAKLVVGADGGKSLVREMAGLQTTERDYSQNAIICTVEHIVENKCAWQRFLPSGPIALLPIGDKFSNIVWTMKPDESSECQSMNEEKFVKSINHALDYGYGPHPYSSNLNQYVDKLSWLTGGTLLTVSENFQVPPKVVRLASERMVFPLSLKHANNYASKRVVLIGDAAHTVHPLAGQGVNLGFGDAAALSKVICEGIAEGADIGQLSLLKRYERERKLANSTMIAVLDGIQKAYSVDLGPPFSLLKGVAFIGAQHLSPLKKNIISYASGEQKWPLSI